LLLFAETTTGLDDLLFLLLFHFAQMLDPSVVLHHFLLHLLNPAQLALVVLLLVSLGILQSVHLLVLLVPLSSLDPHFILQPLNFFPLTMYFVVGTVLVCL